MKLFWVILKGFLIIWVFLMAVVTVLLLAFLEVNQALLVGGIISALATGVIVYFIVQVKAREAERIARKNRSTS